MNLDEGTHVSMIDTVHCSAPAKLNLALSVGRRGEGGLHALCSWMVTINLYDDLTVRRLPPDRLSRYAINWHEDARRPSPINWSIRQDLAVRAHLALEKHAGRPLPVQLHLRKRIPVGSGLGGGSSDAAMMLHAVNQLYELDLSLGDRAAIGHGVSSDIPFLIHGGSAIVGGTGESISPHEEMADMHFVVAFPGLKASTSTVYQVFDEISDMKDPSLEKVACLAACQPGVPRPESLFNDLVPAIHRVLPSLQDDMAHVASLAESPVHVSGSGSSIFVLCQDAAQADTLARRCEKEHGLPAIATCTIPAYRYHAPPHMESPGTTR